MNPKIERKFIGNVTEQFQVWCDKHDQPASQENFLIWLMKHNLIEKSTVKRALVVQEVNNISHCKNISKTNAVIVVEDEYGIPERTCYRILKQHSRKYR